MSTTTGRAPATIFMPGRPTGAWLKLSPKERSAFVDSALEPILAAHPAVTLRCFDAEFHNARVSDGMVWETAELAQYEAVVEGVRETLFWGHDFEVVDIIPAVENAYAQHHQIPVLGSR